MLALFAGGFSWHRLFAGKHKECIFRTAVVLVFTYLFGVIAVKTAVFLAVVEATVSWYICNPDENGKISPLNIIDIMHMAK